MLSGPPQRSLLRHCEAGTTPSGPKQRSLLHRCEARPSSQQTTLRRCVVCLHRSERVLRRGKATHIQGLYKYPRWPFFPSSSFWCTPSSPVSSCVHFFFSDFEPSVTTMAAKKTVPTKRHHSGSTSRATPPSLDDLHRFISQEAERLYHKSLCICSFLLERGFLTSNVFFNFTIQTQGWQTLCAPPTPGVALVVREFYSCNAPKIP